MPWDRKDCQIEGKGELFDVVPLDAAPRLMPVPLMREMFSQAAAGFAQSNAVWAPSDASCTFVRYPGGNLAFIARAPDPRGGDDFFWWKEIEKRVLHEPGKA